MKKKFYHATSFENLCSIMDDGIKPGCDGIVYLCEKEIDAVKFPYTRLIRNILVCEVEIEEDKVEETFDHSYLFYKCKAYGYPDVITPDEITGYRKWEF